MIGNNFSVQCFSALHDYQESIADAVKGKKRKCNEKDLNTTPSKRISEKAIDVFTEVENLSTSEESVNQRNALGFYKKALKTADDEKKLDIHHNIALIYEKQGRYLKALNQWKILSNMVGGRESFCRMGNFYLKGHPGIQKNDKRALTCFRKGSKLGCPDAEFNIGVTFDILRSEIEDFKKKNTYRLKAIRQYKKIAKNKSHVWAFHAEFNKTFLSHLDEDGSFAPKNLEKAKKSYTRLFQKNVKSEKNDSRVPLTCMFVDYLATKAKNDESQNMGEWLTKAVVSGSSIANKMSTYGNSAKFRISMEVELSDPTGIYLDLSK